jgi:hypothetical protein
MPAQSRDQHSGRFRRIRQLTNGSPSHGLMGTLTNLHKGTGLSVSWVLLVDTLAGSVMLLSLYGLCSWMSTQRRRTVGCIMADSAAARM